MPPLDIQQYVADFFKLPSPALQKEWAREWEEITVHTRGKYPKGLIDSRRPYEPEEVRKFRKDNYEAITKDPFCRAITALQRILSKSSVTFHGPEELEDYLEQPAFKGLDAWTYFSRFVLKRMIEDPNGVLAWWVDEIPELNVQAAPQPYLVLSKNIVHWTHQVFSWKSPENSVVLIPDPAGNGRKVEAPEGDVYYIITDDAYYKLSQYGPIEKRLFELIPHYAHKLGRIPVHVLGGDEDSKTDLKTNEEQCWFTTYFHPAMAFANETIRQFSDHQGVMTISGQPMRDIAAPKCVAKGCNGTGTIQYTEGNKVKEKDCEVCNGRGRIIPAGPFGVLYREESNMMTEGKGAEVPALRYIAPPVENVKYSGDYWQILFDRLQKALNLLFVEEAQSGKAKEIDREDRAAFLDRVGQHFFNDLFLSSCIDIADLRFIAYDRATIGFTLPPTFVAKTEADLLAEQEVLTKTNVSPLFRVEVGREHTIKRFPGNMRVQRMDEVLASYDQLYGYAPEEKTAMQAGGQVVEDVARRSTYGQWALTRLVEVEGEEVLLLDFEAIEKKMDDLINEMVPEPEPEPAPLVPVG